jgi:hypothetical protein
MLQQLQVHRQILFHLVTYYLEPLGGMFERLAYLATLRDPSTGKYRHERLGPAYGEVAVNEAVAKAHEELFERLLETPLAQQETDLRAFLQSRENEREFTPKIVGGIFPRWIPENAPDFLKDLFRSNLNALCELLEDRTPKTPSNT